MKKRILDSKSTSSKRVSNGLVALSSVAVLTVYSAGYARTRAAAARFELPAGRRSGQRSAPPAAAATALLPSDATASSSAPIAAHAAAPSVELKGASSVPAASAEPPKIESHPTSTSSTVVSPQPLDSNAPAPIAAAPSLPAHDSAVALIPAPTPAAAPAPVPAPASPSSPPPAPAASTTPSAPIVADAPPVDPAEEPYVFRGSFKKDGTFLGWGYSRHGDIQASVRIENGRIVSAVIVQCLTRYSCDVIDKLPPQVAARQSADVDHVTGATESADAFYDAVVDALSKVK